jgi:hypothetical protein
MPVKGDQHPFIDEYVTQAPDSPGVYQLETRLEVVYVGMAEKSIRERLRDHLAQPSIDCARSATRVRVETHDNPMARLQELLRERLLDKGRLPKCNGAAHRR